MGLKCIYDPQFLIDPLEKPTLHKLMFIKKGGKATHRLGDLTRDFLDAELICISNENENEWIGNYSEGVGFFRVHFAKEDCRDATEDEIKLWVENKYKFKY